MNAEEKKLKVRDDWMALEDEWMEAHIKARGLREKADKAKWRFAETLYDEMHAKALQEQQEESPHGIDTRTETADRG
ncbi:hypothetical protein Rleg2_1130 [Rhizobium leguminosarum bv. trifolii WSM2304]|uniref:Uncharacterized protein n=1 Tax=Rhizobium leguminosarum bv. trifolii (strain WSM2304) TaxID=395492 RepID=A0ABF7QKD1_RHILW|nr:hypothetical protein [Rhizobium leguminosarum]ACI54424.1 hypothetical protein Rleg2_1130 [Rhizobium leguminosarum bv. trifolii WSM2304]